MKKLAMALLVVVMTATSLVVGTRPAAAASHNTLLTRGWSIWTREYCMDGTLVTWRRLHFGAKFQGREYVYRRGGRMCVFTEDHLAGSHNINLFAKVPGGGYSQDDGYYTEYAGALAAPRGRCIVRGSSLMLGSREYTDLTQKVC